MKKTHRDTRRQVGRASAWLFALMCGLVSPTAVLSAENTTKVTTQPTSSSTDCNCVLPYRVYDRAPTPEQRALFEAAQRADVATFMQLLPRAGQLDSVAVQNQPILTAIIRPDPTLKAKNTNRLWQQTEERQRIFTAHRQTVPARLSMLKAALKQGARPNDITYQSQQPALHLAIVYGSPAMVEMLLKNKADPRQAERRFNRTPLDFLLDHEFFMRMDGLPEVLTRDERTQIVAQLRSAGSPEPHIRNWTDVIALTSGDVWLKHLLAQHKPSVNDLMNVENGVLPTATAAYLGDTKALRTLMAHLPRYAPQSHPPFDVRLDAAMAAILGDHPDLARSLLQPNMNWLQRGLRGGNRLGAYGMVEYESQDQTTVLAIAAQRGDVPLARQLLDWGAPIGEGLLVATKRRDQAMIRLLMTHGGEPTTTILNGLGDGDSPLGLALKEAAELLPLLLANPSEATRKALRIEAHDLLDNAFKTPLGATESRRPLIDALLNAGVQGATLSPHYMQAAIASGDIEALQALHTGGAPWPQDAIAEAMATGRLDLVERVVELSGQSPAQSCPTTFEQLNRLIRESPEFADRLFALGLSTRACAKAGPLSHRLLLAWSATDSRPLMGTRHQRAQALLARLWQVDPAQRTLPPTLWQALISRHRPDTLSLALSGQPPQVADLGTLAQHAIAERNPEALRQLRPHGLTAQTRLPDGQTLAWHLDCARSARWRELSGFADLPATRCPAQHPRKLTAAENALAKRVSGRYSLAGVREMASDLTLKANGRYGRATNYGPIDEFIEGDWHVDGEDIVLKSQDTLPAPLIRVLKATYAPEVAGVQIRAFKDGRILRGPAVLIAGRQANLFGALSPKDEQGWSTFANTSVPIGQLEGVAVGVAHQHGLRWTLLPLTPDAQGHLPNKIVIELDTAVLNGTVPDLRLRLEDDALVDSAGRPRGRYERYE